MKEIAVIAPIQDLYDKAVGLVVERGYDNVDVVPGSMSEGVKAAHLAIEGGAKYLVSRGGTYRMLKAEFPRVPIVEIKVSAFDILKSFEKVKDSGGTIGVVGYSNVVYGMDVLHRILNCNFIEVQLKRESDIYQVIQEHKNRGIETYIGDANIIPIVRKLNCNGILITSQKDSILSAVQEARRICMATREEKERVQEITTITDFVHDAIVAVNEEERITVYNKKAESIFGIPRETALGKKVKEIIPNTRLPEVLHTGEAQLGELQNIGKIKLATNRVPVVVEGNVIGVVATFQAVSEVQSMEQKIRRTLYEKGFIARYHFSDIIHSSEKIQDCIETAEKYAKYDTPVHLFGESGVGKELFCQSMHNSSPRRGGPFVAVNCAAIPPALIESEFFGYEEGSFTGARRNGKPGVFELAHGGTLFLDEISEIPIELQGRLLRVIQEKQVMRVGGNKIIPVDVKIITASNKNIYQEMQKGRFRKDLFFRINVLTLDIPPLSERREDILVLANYFIKKYSTKYQKPELKMTQKVQDYLENRTYEGNIRELEGLMERCVIVSSFDGLFRERLPSSANLSGGEDPFDKFCGRKMDLRALEEAYIRSVLEETGGDIKKTCQILKISRSTLWRKCRDMEQYVSS
ncbi:Anaerobic nitric oxide reductase transcription regulator NorR [Caprobacter fermentans]|uniref:Anaerobic nitric oxide reductase transcription regulator NorR n=1 Tax=Caproicibacter fermentans TaxID=2576756 RepID=A0A6N8I3F6_9FIRM|nr:sigma 54-interacting transcriptional regulator [Caproicibacter fermentans]MVB12478.1 Anaerobic nitric oxide reductase transcription regulator NorR [Caproicibacter fermentans]OCN01499.1 Fis family transcriptional regulator [Clostridium sp. W14A]